MYREPLGSRQGDEGGDRASSSWWPRASRQAPETKGIAAAGAAVIWEPDSVRVVESIAPSDAESMRVGSASKARGVVLA